MSFVQSLRMRNMFPVNSDLGSARVDLGRTDPMYDIIEEYRQRVEQERMNRPMTGLQSVGRSVSNQPIDIERPEPLRFGGVVGQQSNPGADILNRSKRSAEDLYASYSDPKNPPLEKGPSNDQKHLNEYFGKKLAEKKVDVDLQEAEIKRDIARQNTASKGWDTVTITDPADPSKQISARHNKITGETRPIELDGGIITRTGSAKDIQAQQALQAEKATRRQNIKDKAQSTLDLMNDLITDKDELTPEAARAVGLSSVGNWIPTTKGYSGSAKIKRLASERILDIIGEMKAQSRTGATGFGQMNIRELGVLEKAASMLDTGLDEETFRKELIRIKGLLNKAITDVPEGTIKVFPNGKKGRWDSQTSQWELIEE